LEEGLIASDVGAQTTAVVLKDLTERFKRKDLSSPGMVRERLRQVLQEVLAPASSRLTVTASPFAILVVGVNGTGKTTTIGKLASRLKSEGKTVLLAAGDTFRISIGQLPCGATVRHRRHQASQGADPGAVVYAIAATARADVLIVDTAGRLHTNRTSWKAQEVGASWSGSFPERTRSCSSSTPRRARMRWSRRRCVATPWASAGSC
jgi:fused signal recognition particle receptor